MVHGTFQWCCMFGMTHAPEHKNIFLAWNKQLKAQVRGREKETNWGRRRGGKDRDTDGNPEREKKKHRKTEILN